MGGQELTPRFETLQLHAGEYRKLIPVMALVLRQVRSYCIEAFTDPVSH